MSCLKIEDRNAARNYTTPFLFNGKELDEETGLYYYGARYYNPKISNWLSVDPIALYDPINETEHYIDGQHNGGYFNPKNMSVYGYTYQNPVLYVDPNGKQSKAVSPKNTINGETFQAWRVTIVQHSIYYNSKTNRYEHRSHGTTTENRLRSSKASANRYLGATEHNFEIQTKGGKHVTMNSQNSGADAAGKVQNIYNPLNMDNVNSTRKAGEMLEGAGDVTTKAGIATGNPIIGGIGFGLELGGALMQAGADLEVGDINSGITKGASTAAGEILNRIGDKVIDSKVKNPVANKAAKTILQEGINQANNAINK